jgi:serine/threonine-protein kinase HipA
MLAAPDGHAKNFSIRVLPQGRYQLTPLYDVMSIWPVEGNGPNQFSMFKAKMAMAVQGKNKHYHFKDIQRRHFNNMAVRLLNRTDAEDLMEELIKKTPIAIESVRDKLGVDFPEHIAQSIFEGVVSTTNRLGAMPPT